MWEYNYTQNSNELYHWGIKGQRWGVRRFQNPDGTLTPEGMHRYGIDPIQAKQMTKEEMQEYAQQKEYEKTRARKKAIKIGVGVAAGAATGAGLYLLGKYALNSPEGKYVIDSAREKTNSLFGRKKVSDYLRPDPSTKYKINKGKQFVSDAWKTTFDLRRGIGSRVRMAKFFD